ncbi:MAG: putative membrane protein [Gammaproteobacteria bacterium]
MAAHPVAAAQRDHGEPKTMSTAGKLLSSTEIASIEHAIGEAEKTTAAEIVPVIATASGRYDRGEDLFGLVFACVTLVGAWFAVPGKIDLAWSATSSPGLGIALSVAIVVGGFVIGAALATRITALRLPFIAREEMLEEVERRAIETFQRQRIRSTSRATGVLIYVSLYERIVKVLGDDNAAVQLPPAALEEICALVIDGLKQGNPATGLESAIRKTGELLAPHLPATPDDTNELANRLILID